MSRRAPSAPPRIDGFEYVSVIGSGGFSDVFLYEQRRPSRRVAVKVLLHEWSSEAQRAAFDAEADLMATLSTHPSIVTMYEAGVSSDGRPFLAMEYCSRPNLGSRYRRERFSVPEALRVAVQIAGAVETAHQAGILHRDIKPSNILVTDYGHPALTDFGISSTVDDAARAEGMSIPWSPPESFAEPPVSGIGTDVWALGATVYTLLAGRSPFEVPGGSNTSADLIHRIENSPLPPTGRSDVPASLERVLATSMAKSVTSRYPNVLAFARALQEVQNELTLSATPIDLLEQAGHAHDDEPEGGVGTRLRQVVSIDPRSRSGAPTPDREPGGRVPLATGVLDAPAGHDPLESTTTRGRRTSNGHGRPPLRTTLDASATIAEEDEYVEVPARRRLGRLIVIVVGVVLAIGGGAYLLLTDRDAPTASETTTDGTGEEPGDPIGDLVPPVIDLTGTYDEAANVATFTWSQDPAQAQDGDTFAWKVLDQIEDTQYQRTDVPRAEVSAGPERRVCIEVVVVRDGRQSVAPQRSCQPS